LQEGCGNRIDQEETPLTEETFIKERLKDPPIMIFLRISRHNNELINGTAGITNKK